MGLFQRKNAEERRRKIVKEQLKVRAEIEKGKRKEANVIEKDRRKLVREDEKAYKNAEKQLRTEAKGPRKQNSIKQEKRIARAHNKIDSNAKKLNKKEAKRDAKTKKLSEKMEELEAKELSSFQKRRLMRKAVREGFKEANREIRAEEKFEKTIDKEKIKFEKAVKKSNKVYNKYKNKENKRDNKELKFSKFRKIVGKDKKRITKNRILNKEQKEAFRQIYGKKAPKRLTTQKALSTIEEQIKEHEKHLDSMEYSFEKQVPGSEKLLKKNSEMLKREIGKEEFEKLFDRLNYERLGAENEIRHYSDLQVEINRLNRLKRELEK